jgi:amidohydrolase
MISNQTKDWLVTLRRWFHQHPEVGYEEKRTATKICRTLDELQVPYISEVGGTGVIARLQGSQKVPKVAFRCDMDALPLEEKNTVAYRSRHSGRMHACGHDGHMAIALGIIRHLIEDGWRDHGPGEIIFIFQPAEEGGAGAKAMLDTGLLDEEPIQAIFAGHLYPKRPIGQVELISGKAFAAVDVLDMQIRGRGGHGAAPDQCIDPILAASQLITQLQSIVSQGIDPLENVVLTIGEFHAGTAANIIPESANLRGTLRTLRSEVKNQVLEKIEKLLAGLEQGFGVKTHLKQIEGYPVLVNHPEIYGRVFDCASEILGRKNVIIGRPSMGSEDFAYFCNRWPGMMVWLGCGKPQETFRYGLHSPHFDMDENALVVGVELFVHILESLLKNSTTPS